MTNTISKEKSFEESNDITNIIVFKEKIENLIHCKTPTGIAFKEECHEIIALLKTTQKNNNLENRGTKFHEASKKIRMLADKYSEYISETEYELLYNDSNNIQLLGNLFIATHKIQENLSTNSSLKVLKQWANWTELFAEIVEIHKDILANEKLNELKELAKLLISTTFIKDPKQTNKNKLKRSIRHSATFILNIVENCKPNNSWKLVIGKKTYQELLLESQKNIHLLEELEPKTDDEHEKQLDTLEYLKKELKWE
jgi:hypothetical protein